MFTFSLTSNFDLFPFFLLYLYIKKKLNNFALKEKVFFSWNGIIILETQKFFGGGTVYYHELSAQQLFLCLIVNLHKKSI